MNPSTSVSSSYGLSFLLNPQKATGSCASPFVTLKSSTSVCACPSTHEGQAGSESRKQMGARVCRLHEADTDKATGWPQSKSAISHAAGCCQVLRISSFRASIRDVYVARSKQAAHKLECYYIELMQSHTVSGYNQLLGFPQQKSRYWYLHRRGRMSQTPKNQTGSESRSSVHRQLARNEDRQRTDAGSTFLPIL